MRLFFALWPPPEIAQCLAEMARSVADTFGGRPTRHETIHLTLSFLGDVSEERLPLLAEAAQGVQAPPFHLDINGLGYWRHNHLIWAGVAPSEPLLNLAGQLNGVPCESWLGSEKGKHGFVPHLSLVRKVPDANVIELPGVDVTRWHCDRFALVCSRLSGSPPFYETVHEFPLIAFVPTRTPDPGYDL